MSKSTNKAAVPEAMNALERFKYEVASEIGVPLTDGYNGDLTSKQNGSVGGYMVKKMIEAQEQQDSGLILVGVILGDGAAGENGGEGLV